MIRIRFFNGVNIVNIHGKYFLLNCDYFAIVGNTKWNRSFLRSTKGFHRYELYYPTFPKTVVKTVPDPGRARSSL
jgi:hypothetical protein